MTSNSQCPPWCTVTDHEDFTGSPDIHAAWHTMLLELHPDGDGYEDVKAGLDQDPAYGGGPHVTVVPLSSAECTVRMTLGEAEQLAASISYWVATARAGKLR